MLLHCPGFCGLLLVPPWSRPPGGLHLQILGNGSGNTLVNNWVGVLVVLLAIVMNEGAVDSLQNGLAAGISGQYLKNMPLIWTR
jgi:hypothetical protein